MEQTCSKDIAGLEEKYELCALMLQAPKGRRVCMKTHICQDNILGSKPNERLNRYG
jgi:hypothetical protein